MESHCKFKPFQTRLYLLQHLCVFDCDNFEHLFHVKNEILEVAIFLHDFINRECNSGDSLSTHIVHHLALFGDKVGYLHQICHFVDVVGTKFVLCDHICTLVRCYLYSKQYCNARARISTVAARVSPNSPHIFFQFSVNSIHNI